MLKPTHLLPIPAKERQGWVSLALVQAGICVCASSFLEGALLAEAMPLGEAILAGTLGNLIVVVLMTIIGFQGSDLGIASCTLSESSFGKERRKISSQCSICYQPHRLVRYNQ